MTRNRWRAPALLALCALSACATPDRRRSETEVQSLLSTRQPAVGVVDRDDNAAVAQRVDALLAEPLSRDAAIELAMLNHPRIRAEYAALGLARADWIAGSRLSNPQLGLLRTRTGGDPHRGYVRSLTLQFTELLLLPARQRMAADEFARAQRQIAASLWALARETETAWLQAVSARQLERLRATIAKAADLSAQLAERMHAAGTLPELTLRMEQAAASEARIEARRASLAAREARSALAVQLGLGVEREWQIPEALPAPPAQTPALAELSGVASTLRLDLEIAQQELALREQALTLARRWRWLGEVEIEGEHENESDGARTRGWALSLELPLFQQGQASVLRAQSERDAAAAHLDALRLSVDQELALAHARVESTAAIAADYRDHLLPQRAAVVDGTQRMVNFMLKGAFELLQARREEYAGFEAYLSAVRDYWLARAELERALGGTLPADPDAASIDVDALLSPAAADAGHEHGHEHHAPAPKPAAEPAAEDEHAHHHHQEAP